MASPTVQVTAISNVYSRLMHFRNKGDIEIGHSHTYDHATIVTSGSVLYEVLDGLGGESVASKVFHAPGHIFVEADKYHKITALEDNTVCACIHALRTIDEEIVSPDMFIDPLTRTRRGEVNDVIRNKTGKRVLNIVAVS